MNRLGILISTAALVCLVSTARPAQATPILGQSLIATGGDVVVTFVSNGAGYTNELFLDGATGTIFNNWATPVGTSVNLGSFLAGTELIFGLFVTNTGDVFYSGAGSRNPDGIAHAAVDNGLNQATVGFEDLLGGGDRDYNDLVFSFSNVRGTDAAGSPFAVSEPAALTMLGGGLAALVGLRRRWSNRR